MSNSFNDKIAKVREAELAERESCLLDYLDLVKRSANGSISESSGQILKILKAADKNSETFNREVGEMIGLNKLKARADLLPERTRSYEIAKDKRWKAEANHRKQIEAMKERQRKELDRLLDKEGQAQSLVTESSRALDQFERKTRVRQSVASNNQINFGPTKIDSDDQSIKPYKVQVAPIV